MYASSFEWDESKNESNQRTHGASFEEARSGKEDRYIMVGLSSHLRVLLVVHTFREEDGVIRLISARKPTAKERAVYLERRR